MIVKGQHVKEVDLHQLEADQDHMIIDINQLLEIQDAVQDHGRRGIDRGQLTVAFRENTKVPQDLIITDQHPEQDLILETESIAVDPEIVKGKVLIVLPRETEDTGADLDHRVDPDLDLEVVVRGRTGVKNSKIEQKVVFTYFIKVQFLNCI